MKTDVHNRMTLKPSARMSTDFHLISAPVIEICFKFSAAVAFSVEMLGQHFHLSLNGAQIVLQVYLHQLLVQFNGSNLVTTSFHINSISIQRKTEGSNACFTKNFS